MGGAVGLSLAFWEQGVLAGAEGAAQGDLINPRLLGSSLGVLWETFFLIGVYIL